MKYRGKPMDKDEILRKAQFQKGNKPDEMEQLVQKTGCKNSLTFGIALCIVLTILKLRAGVSFNDVYAVWGSMASIYNLYVWKELKDKSNLFLGIVWGTGSFVCLILYITEIF